MIQVTTKKRHVDGKQDILKKTSVTLDYTKIPAAHNFFSEWNSKLEYNTVKY